MVEGGGEDEEEEEDISREDKEGKDEGWEGR